MLRFNALLGGSNAALVAPSSNLDIVLDNRNVSGGVSLTVRHTDLVPVIKLSASKDGGVSFQGGAPSSGASAYVSLQTPADGGQMVERLRADHSGVHVDCLHPNIIANLIDSYMLPNSDMPPTANALHEAFVSLSNLISLRAPASNLLPATYSQVDVDQLMREMGLDMGGSNSGSGSNGSNGSNEQQTQHLPTGVIMPPLLCAHLQVLPGGWVNSPGYCNLAPDHTSTSPTMPPSANALRVAYVTLSNFCVFRTRPGAITGSGGGGVGDGSSNSSSNVFLADNWVVSTPDTVRRMHFQSQGTTTLAASSSSSSSYPPGEEPPPLFRWLHADTDQEVMQLTANAQLRVHGSVSPAGGYCNLPSATPTQPGITALSSSLAMTGAAASNTASSVAAATTLAATLNNMEQRLRAMEGRLVAAGL